MKLDNDQVWYNYLTEKVYHIQYLSTGLCCTTDTDIFGILQEHMDNPKCGWVYVGKL